MRDNHDSNSCSFSKLSVTSPTTQLILQPFYCFIYITAYSPTLLLLHLYHSLFSNPSVASSTSQLILQPFFRFSYVTGSSLTSPDEPPMIKGITFPSLHLRRSSFFNLSVALPTSQLILQPFFHFSYVTGFSLTSPGEPPMPFIYPLSITLR